MPRLIVYDMQYFFPKAKHICGQVRIDELRKNQQRIRAYPLLVGHSLAQRGGARVQVLIIAPKKTFHHAVERNRIKRLLREAIRLQLPDLERKCEQKGICLDLSFVAVGGLFSFEKAQKYVGSVMEKLNKIYFEQEQDEQV